MSQAWRRQTRAWPERDIFVHQNTILWENFIDKDGRIVFMSGIVLAYKWMVLKAMIWQKRLVSLPERGISAGKCTIFELLADL